MYGLDGGDHGVVVPFVSVFLVLVAVTVVSQQYVSRNVSARIAAGHVMA